MTSKLWRGMKYPDSEVVALAHRYARPTSKGDVAIDLGCGPGRHLKLLADMGYMAIGIDNDEAMVSTARENGCCVRLMDAGDYSAVEHSVKLVLAWGFVMVVEDGPEIIAGYNPEIVIADWRTFGNSCYSWPENEILSESRRRIVRAGHGLDGMVYNFHKISDCNIAGYERIFIQKVTKQTDTECNEWYQTVHRRVR